MTGAVSWETLEWVIGIIVAVILAAIAALGMIWRLRLWIDSEFEKRDGRREQEVAELENQVKIVADELGRFQLYAAQHLVTTSEMAAALHGIQQSIDKLDRNIELLRGELMHPPPQRGLRRETGG